MITDYYLYDEARQAQDRIDHIRQGGKPQLVDDGAAFESYDNPHIAQARSRAQGVRLTVAESSGAVVRRKRAQSGLQPGGMRSLAVPYIAGHLVIVALLAGIYLTEKWSGGNLSWPLPSQPTAAETPTPTIEPTPTVIEASPPTHEVLHNLAYPPLDCLHTRPGCYDFFKDPDNRLIYASAREFLSSQRVDPDTWFNCVAPGPGAPIGDPQMCLEEAWRAANT
jgi:hypothetical protein